jgi:class 3 adenylate cyclase
MNAAPTARGLGWLRAAAARLRSRLRRPPRGVREVVLIVADVSGYTRFAAANRTALEHSQILVGELLDAVIREAEIPLRVAKLEGDAVFLYAAREGAGWDAVRLRIAARLPVFFRAFRRRLEELARTHTCNCEMCANMEALRLKVVVHAGEALFTRIGRFDEVMGVDVILVHRLLKNGVEAEEYLLLTGPAREALSLRSPDDQEWTETYDALGPVRVFVRLAPGSDLPDDERKAACSPSWARTASRP